MRLRLNCHIFFCAAWSLLLSALCLCASAQTPARWDEAKAQHWYAQQPWLLGANYLPTNAINELEMWQPATFDETAIDREFGWAQAAGINTMRVFLHNLAWEEDPAAFNQRVDRFLAIAARHHIRPVFVLFDSCWDPDPRLGPQRPPIPGVHNSGWVQAPGRAILADPAQYPRLEKYVKSVVGKFATDPRVLAWDLWNEPDNPNTDSYGKIELANKSALVMNLLPQVFAWAREMNPSQPLTSGIWQGDWASLEKMPAMARLQISLSDVISFHNYGWPEDFEERVTQLEAFHRPLLCTEFMARGAGSTFDTILPIAKKHHVAAISWGLVKGRSQTFLPWDSWKRPYVTVEPTIWFHDIFYEDGRPYRPREIEIMRQLSQP